MSVTEQTIGEDDAGMRLDRWLRRDFAGLTQGRIEKLLRTGKIRVNGSKQTSGYRLVSGDMVRVPQLDDLGTPAPPRPAPTYVPTPDDLKALEAAILHQDKHLIVLNKEAGLAVQGGSGTTRHLDALLDHLAVKGERPRLVHRLDKDTSGVLVLARTAPAARFLTKAFRDRDTLKVYWSLNVGVPDLSEGTIDAPLAKGISGSKEKVGVDEDAGQHAITDFRVIDSAYKTVSWIEFSPKTGRTHQIRVHALVLGTPVLGDGKYAGAGANVPGMDLPKRLHLHARALAIPHPAGGILRVIADPPPHFLSSMRDLGFAPADAPDPFDGWRVETRK